MMNSSSTLESLSSADLLRATRDLVQKSRGVEAELLLHLGEVDERKLYLECAFPSMFAFCVEELGFSEDAAYARITVARAARRLPAMVEAVRSGQVHLTGLRMLVPHLTDQNHREVLAQAAGKSKRGVEELVARLSPQPAVPALIRKLPELPALATVPPATEAPGEPLPIPGPPPGAAVARRAVLAPLTEETFKVQFTASRAFRDKLRQAQDLLRHRVPDGDLAAVLERALDLLIEDVKKERFAVGRKARHEPKEEVAARATFRMRSSERSTNATVGAARSRTSAAGAVARLERSNSITWTDSRARTGMMSTGSGSFAARTTSTRQSRSTDGPSWNEHAHHPRRAEPAPDDSADAAADTCARNAAGVAKRQRSFFC